MLYVPGSEFPPDRYPNTAPVRLVRTPDLRTQDAAPIATMYVSSRGGAIRRLLGSAHTVSHELRAIFYPLASRRPCRPRRGGARRGQHQDDRDRDALEPLRRVGRSSARGARRETAGGLFAECGHGGDD